ncbi:hypothetical protein F4823DRAFT_640177 [Ustulina deusta]|nr:hypothetical protein F4823DRAFT_640177 [Ustulina deusta]
MGYCGAVKTCLFSSPAEAPSPGMEGCPPSPTRVRRLPDDRAPGLVACCIASIVFSTVAVVLRLWSRGVITSLAFWWDDAAILVTLVFSYALLGITLYWTSIGLGQHSHFVFIINNRVNLVFYSACVLLVKISALLLYARIFKASPACFDLVVLILPTPIIWKLQMTLKKKISISLVFLIGYASAFLSLARFIIIVHDPEILNSGQSAGPSCELFAGTLNVRSVVRVPI